MNARRFILAAIVLAGACSSDRLTGVAAQRAAADYQSRQLAPADEPVFFIDGREVDARSARALAPGSIESIEVLKGAAAVTRLGERGARGVVYITTKAADRDDAR